MTREEVANLMTEFFKELQETTEAGQKEYAHDTNNAFRNFEALQKDLDIDRKKVLWVYLKKHLDGILAAINGHISQREPVRGRIKDATVYLILLLGMFEEEQFPKPSQTIGGSISGLLYNDWVGETRTEGDS